MDVLGLSANNTRNPSAFLVSLLSGANSAWAKSAKAPLGAEGVEQLLKRFPALKASFDDSFLETLKFADSGDAEAVLQEVAQSSTENPTKYALGLLKALSQRGPWQDYGTPFGSWRVRKLLQTSPELQQQLGPCALRLLGRTQEEHARRCLRTFQAKAGALLRREPALDPKASTVKKPAAYFTSLLPGLVEKLLHKQ
ncbi:unnamed protein product [Symbiodinium natans]|uniref:Uncharacterized protein n=1 Tax=Symbiodinium natans TaxID=878477 RepID=A0A812P439_9DINO|nr:unnamed protein product [Symbiodinium natans]